MGRVVLERALSKLGIASRSQTRKWIAGGKISVDGQIIKDPMFLVVPEKAAIRIDGKAQRCAVACTIMLHKPRGVVTTKSDEKNRKTVYDLLPVSLAHLHPVGRLDMYTTGLLLMTTDTQFSNFLTDPAHKIPRTYAVIIKGRMKEENLQHILSGIKDKGQTLRATKVILRKVSGKESHLIIELCEGKNREIRRMFTALKSEVTALKRIAFGKLQLANLMPGQFREVSVKEIL